LAKAQWISQAQGVKAHGHPYVLLSGGLQSTSRAGGSLPYTYVGTPTYTLDRVYDDRNVVPVYMNDGVLIWFEKSPQSVPTQYGGLRPPCVLMSGRRKVHSQGLGTVRSSAQPVLAPSDPAEK